MLDFENLTALEERSGSSYFDFDHDRRVLRAIVTVDAPDYYSIQRVPGLALVAERLNHATEPDSHRLRGGGNFEVDPDSGSIRLVREFEIRGLSFSDLLLALRRLERAAERWRLMRPSRMLGFAERLHLVSAD